MVTFEGVCFYTMKSRLQGLTVLAFNPNNPWIWYGEVWGLRWGSFLPEKCFLCKEAKKPAYKSNRHRKPKKDRKPRKTHMGLKYLFHLLVLAYLAHVIFEQLTLHDAPNLQGQTYIKQISYTVYDLIIRDQWPCFSIRIEFNSRRISWGHQHGRRSFV